MGALPHTIRTAHATACGQSCSCTCRNWHCWQCRACMAGSGSQVHCGSSCNVSCWLVAAPLACMHARTSLHSPWLPPCMQLGACITYGMVCAGSNYNVCATTSSNGPGACARTSCAHCACCAMCVVTCTATGRIDGHNTVTMHGLHTVPCSATDTMHALMFVWHEDVTDYNHAPMHLATTQQETARGAGG